MLFFSFSIVLPSVHPMMKCNTAHNSLFLSSCTCFLPLSRHTPQLARLWSRADQNPHLTQPRHVTSAARCVTGLDRGTTNGTISELAGMKVTASKRTASRRLTRLPRASVRLARAAPLLHPSLEHQWIRLRGILPFGKAPGPGHPGLLVLRHIFSLDPLMSLPAWVSQCK